MTVQRYLFVASMLFLLGGGCSPTGPGGTQGITLSMRMQTQPAYRVHLQNSDSVSMSISEATLSVSRFAIKLPDTLDCSDVFFSTGTSCNNGEIRLSGPFAVNLRTAASTPSFSFVSLPQGRYDAIDALIANADTDGPVDPASDLYGYALLLRGHIYSPTIDTVYYTLRSRIENDLRFSLQPALSLGRDSTAELSLEFTTQQWFSNLKLGECFDILDIDLDLVERIDIDETISGSNCTALFQQLETNMAASVSAKR